MSAARPTNVLVVGVGGQGVILISKVMARLAQRHGLEVKQSEVHGMAKRGGSVFSHVRFGAEVWAPTIPLGEADIVVALEWAEGLRWLPYLNPATGSLVVDTRRIVPPFGCIDRHRGAAIAYPDTRIAEVAAHVRNLYALDAEGMAEDLGNARVANTVLLGVMSTALDFPAEEWQRVLGEFVPPRTFETNLAAFAAGRAWAERVHAAPPLYDEPAPLAAPAAAPRDLVELEITAAWCKSCDICVKMCPEMCLRLDAQQKVELVDPAACTGCRVCEWLCPDFAIKVNLVPIAEIAA
ncbi:MAG TPA: 2-oxoacid:acceptor oxidoreductase family protein [Gammaproteobacteria bacterium]|nr:2-oxoacid:acceptor oxidoreductase family protein [Gammaproteobacteria bacterium]